MEGKLYKIENTYLFAPLQDDEEILNVESSWSDNGGMNMVQRQRDDDRDSDANAMMRAMRRRWRFLGENGQEKRGE
ncbi:hypothetical protein RHGRI_026127 [Rhododendron griersonianum]|uniref:Uncharacterized protein n=1 Tax=Rhododendron griersonianum TaxID=479676 RepID=A0AAV6ISK4_9ERIC|nr:hypothetical protein RHGRI_026127 [Rhododendron griersonianum]